MKSSLFISAILTAASIFAAETKYDFEKITEVNGKPIPSQWHYYEYFNKDGGELGVSEDAANGDFAMLLKAFSSAKRDILFFANNKTQAGPGSEVSLSFSIKGKGTVMAFAYFYTAINYAGKVETEKFTINSNKFEIRKVKLTLPTQKFKDKEISDIVPVFAISPGSEVIIDDLVVKVEERNESK